MGFQSLCAAFVRKLNFLIWKLQSIHWFYRLVILLVVVFEISLVIVHVEHVGSCVLKHVIGVAHHHPLIWIVIWLAILAVFHSFGLLIVKAVVMGCIKVCEFLHVNKIVRKERFLLVEGLMDSYRSCIEIWIVVTPHSASGIQVFEISGSMMFASHYIKI